MGIIEKPIVKVLMLKGEKGEKGDIGDVSLQQLINEQTARINADNNLQTQINSLAGGTPIVVSSTSDMTDTSKIYVNTTDGNWYYYNDSNWTIGGNYASSSEELQQEIEKLTRIVSGLPTKNASGTNIVLNDMVNCEIKEISLKGDTSQDGTPTPESPVAIKSANGNQEINVYGKNLAVFYENILSIGGLTSTLNSDGTITTTGLPDANYVKITGQYNINDMLINGETYTLSQSMASQLIYLQLSKINKITGTASYTYLSSNASETFVADTDTYTYSINVQSGQLTDWNNTSQTITSYYQLEKGSTATTFEKYRNTNYPISLGTIELNKIGTYQDKIYKNNDKWYLEKNIGKVVLDGITNAFGSYTHYDNYERLGLYANNSKMSGWFEIQNQNYIYCDKLSNVGSISNPQVNSIYSWNAVNTIYAFLQPNSFSSKEEANDYLKTNNMIIYYVYATPVITEITDANLINQLEAVLDIILNTNNTIITNGELPVIIDITGYVDIMSLISTQNNRNIVLKKKTVTIPVEEPIDEPIEEPIDEPVEEPIKKK